MYLSIACKVKLGKSILWLFRLVFLRAKKINKLKKKLEYTNENKKETSL